MDPSKAGLLLTSWLTNDKMSSNKFDKAHNPTFKASLGWLYKFMRHNRLSMRVKTSISQKLPIQLEKKIEEIF